MNGSVPETLPFTVPKALEHTNIFAFCMCYIKMMFLCDHHASHEYCF